MSPQLQFDKQNVSQVTGSVAWSGPGMNGGTRRWPMSYVPCQRHFWNNTKSNVQFLVCNIKGTFNFLTDTLLLVRLEL